MDKLHELHRLGQSIWLDYIRRSYTRGGQLARLVQQGLRGVTSNPTIFEKAITSAHDYDDQLRIVTEETDDPETIYESLAITDIREAADTLRPVYDESDRADGFVSLEVSPTLAYDTQGTIDAAKRLFEAVSRPNLMIKIPATAEGIPAIRSVISAGYSPSRTTNRWLRPTSQDSRSSPSSAVTLPAWPALPPSSSAGSTWQLRMRS
jgi:transaldolase